MKFKAPVGSVIVTVLQYTKDMLIHQLLGFIFLIFHGLWLLGPFALFPAAMFLFTFLLFP
jgi:hypothetical protein